MTSPAKPLVYGLITARGGSKSVPKKNIKDLCGKPLIAWTIEAAKSAPSIDRLVCSTDSEEIAAVAREFGAETPFLRPAEFAQDLTPDLPVLEHALTWFRDNEGKMPDLLVHLRPTSPLRVSADIERAVALLQAHPEADSLRCVAKAPHHPMKTYRLDADGGMLQPFIPESVYGIPEPYNAPRQALPKAYASLGYLSVIRPRTVLELHSTCGKNIVGMIVDADNAIDIDSAIDFEMARIAMAQRLGMTP
ncbi:acylneuraminate cytidylyltransferase family protein [Patescibacteria group bacterium]|nr:MAG: acylneuraminate cytidylyltransferase family protein [Patescibacteria group bacterium]